MDECINKMQYIGTMEDYPVLKGKGNLTCIPYG
jgi:hypothetical protein